MGNDVHCAFCGALASKPFWDDEDGEDSYDPTVLQSDDTAWMEEVRIIGKNPYSKSINKVFISGPAHYDDSSFFDVEASDDPNFPSPEHLDAHGNTTTFRVYDTDWGFPLTIPFHLLCFKQIFPKTVRYIESKQRHTFGTIDEVDIDLLYEALASICPQDYSYCLSIDYGPIGENHDQYWPTSRGEEAFVTNPDCIYALDNYYSNLPEYHPKDKSPNQYSSQDELRTSSDPFVKLPAEILLKILLLLPINSVNCFRAASETVQSVPLSNSFWRLRVLEDMPWLYDLPLDELREKEGTVSWATVYNDMLRRSEPSSSEKINGLVNRRRIWGLCEQIAAVYLSRLDNFFKSNKDADAETLKDATASSMVKVLSTSSAKFDSFRFPIIQNWNEVSRVSLIISADWNELGILEALNISKLRKEDNGVPGDGRNLARNETAKLNEGDWISGVVLTLREGKRGSDGVCGFEVLNIDSSPILKFGKMTGNKRLLNISPQRIVVGIHGETAKGIISALSLLEAAPPQSSDLQHLLTSMSKSPYAKTQVDRYLWKNELPPPNISVSRFETGYWDYEFAIETSPVEHLIFGQQEQDLATITGFAADYHLGGFRIEYSDRPAKHIGPSPSAMSVFTIDGAGGERITEFSLKIGHIPKCLSLRTNWGRTCVFGYEAQSQDTWQNAPRGKFIVGVAGIWETGRRTKLTSAAMIMAPLSGFKAPRLHDKHDQPPIEDAEGRIWEPSPPPLEWKETGPIFGNNSTKNEEIGTGGNHTMPTDAGKISWLNLCQPVTKVEVWFTHPVKDLFGQHFISLIFHYPDNSRVAIGPQDFDSAMADKLPACDCKKYVLPYNHGKSSGRTSGGAMLLPMAVPDNNGGTEELNVDGNDDNADDHDIGDIDKDDEYSGNDAAEANEDQDMIDYDESGEEPSLDVDRESEEGDTDSKTDQDENAESTSGSKDNEQPDDDEEYTTDEWPYPREHLFPGEPFQLALDGEKLHKINIWSSVFLDGLQFVTQAGAEGPKWGTCKGAPTGSIVFGPGDLKKTTTKDKKNDTAVVMGAIGLKIFSGRNARPVTHEDVIFYGIQALAGSGS